MIFKKLSFEEKEPEVLLSNAFTQRSQERNTADWNNVFFPLPQGRRFYLSESHLSEKYVEYLSEMFWVGKEEVAS